MSRTVSPSVGRRYGLALVCRVWEIARSSVYSVRTRLASPALETRKRGPKAKWTDAELTVLIRRAIETSPWLGEGYRTVWARRRLLGHPRFQATGAAADATCQPTVAVALVQVADRQGPRRQDHHRPAR
jgi:hypothetical protein